MIATSNPPTGFEAIVSHSPYGWRLGPMFEKHNGEAICRGFRVAEKHIDRNGNLATGMITTFADILLAQPVLYHVKAPFVTLRMTADYTGVAGLGDWLEGVATLSGVTNDIVSVNGEIYTEKSKVASIQALFKARYRRPT